MTKQKTPPDIVVRGMNADGGFHPPSEFPISLLYEYFNTLPGKCVFFVDFCKV